MRFLLGTDEAGYGPNLGPLVVAASGWEAPERIQPDTLLQRAGRSRLPRADPRRRRPAGNRRLQAALSGGVFAGGLERGVLALLSLLERRVTCWKDCWPCLADKSPDHCSGCDFGSPSDELPPWHNGYDEPLPVHVAPAELQTLVAALADGCRSRKVRFTNLQATVISPRRFNDLVDEFGNKAEVLSLTTLHSFAG